NNKIIIIILVTAVIATSIIFASSISSSTGDISSTGHSSSSTGHSSSNKVVILTFSGSSKSQYVNARPILNEYGFKGSFFITCNWVGSTSSKSPYMTWQNIATLQKEGHDIESEAMTHKALTKLSATALDYEARQSKRCLSNHGINATVFATPYGKGGNNATVINTIAKYYNFSVSGFSNLMYLHCNGWKQRSGQQQSDCSTYLHDGSLTYANRYSIKEWGHNTFDIKYSHNDTQIFKVFVDEVNSQAQHNSNGVILTIPIIAYHKIDNSKGRESTNVNLFANEMKYLHDNKFKVITMADLVYDKNNKYIRVRDIPGVTTGSR
ncbi:MAG TPA: polysaccharide deacetylase family protein, partial [Nitrososphaeraceae archaeon]|nr:polysaccharide deacetylase family protein [Nitrososphaeraceae archaeon]